MTEKPMIPVFKRLHVCLHCNKKMPYDPTRKECPYCAGRLKAVYVVPKEYKRSTVKK